MQCGALSLQARAPPPKKKQPLARSPDCRPTPSPPPISRPAPRSRRPPRQAGPAPRVSGRPLTRQQRPESSALPGDLLQAWATPLSAPGGSCHVRTARICRGLSPTLAHHSHTLTRGHTRDVGAPLAAAEWRRAGTRPVYSLQEAENFLSATTTSASTTQVASRAAMTMAAMAPGPSEPAEDGGRVSPGPGPPGPSRPASPSPSPSARTCALVQALPRGAVLGARRSGGGWGAGGLGLPGWAAALHGAFSRWHLGRLVPQGGHWLLRALGCKAKDRSWGPGSTACQDMAVFPQSPAWESGLCPWALGLSTTRALRSHRGGKQAERPCVAPRPPLGPGCPQVNTDG